MIGVFFDGVVKHPLAAGKAVCLVNLRSIGETFWEPGGPDEPMTNLYRGPRPGVVHTAGLGPPRHRSAG